MTTTNELGTGGTQPAGSSKEGESWLPFDLRELWQIVRANRWVIVGSATLFMVLATLWTARQPSIYRAEAVLEYDPNPPRALSGDIAGVADPVSSFWMTQEFYETQNAILKSRSLAARVVEKLGLHRATTFTGRSSPVSVDAAAVILQRRLTIEEIPETRLVELHVEDTDPERAALIANALGETYIERTMEERLSATVEALAWLREQLDSLQGRLNGSELSLHEFKTENNILSVSMEDKQNLISQNIQELSTALTGVRGRRIELQARLDQLRRANAEDPLMVDATAVTEDPAIASLRQEYRATAAELETLLTRYGEAHPRIEALTAQLDVLRSQLRREIDSVIAAAAGDVAEAAQVEGGLKESLDDVHDQGLELNRLEIEYSRLQRNASSQSKLYDLLLTRTAEMDLSRMQRVSRGHLVDRALAPKVPVRPQMTLNVTAGFLLGGFLGLILAVGYRRLDRTIRSIEQAEGLGLPILGIVPQTRELAKEADEKTARRRRRKKPGDEVRDERAAVLAHRFPMSTLAECCRAIRTNLTFLGMGKPARTLVVTSAQPREGKTTVASNLAIVLAQSGQRVLLLDTDLRRPRVHKGFGLHSNTGTTSILVGEATLAEAVQRTEVDGLDVLACGPVPPNPSELLHTTAFRRLLEEAARSYDRVLLDSPPLGAVTDAAVIAPQVDGTILVVQANSTSKEALMDSLRQLRVVNAKLLGGILNDVDLTSDEYRYGRYQYYYSGKEYYAEAEPPAEAAE